MGRVFANGPGDLGSFPGRVIPKTLKMVLDTSLLNTQQYKVRIKGKLEQSWEKSSSLPTPRCSSYWKGSLLVAFDYGQLCLYSIWREKMTLCPILLVVEVLRKYILAMFVLHTIC